MANTPPPDVNTQLNQVGSQINTDQNAIKQFNDPTSYFSLLTKVGDASYAQNQDLIGYRQALRTKLYGDTNYKPDNFNLLDASQQDTVRNAGRPELLAGIQAANETQAARGNNLNDLLTTEKGRFSDQRQALVDNMNTLVARRGQLENNIKTTEKNGVITGYDGVSGKQLYRIDTGQRDYHPGSGTTPSTIVKAAQLGFTLEHNPIGGVNFLQNGKPVTPIDWEHQLGKKGLNISYLDALDQFGTLDSGDIGKLTKAGYRSGVTATTQDTASQEASTRQWLSTAEAKAMTREQRKTEILSVGLDPKKFGY